MAYSRSQEPFLLTKARWFRSSGICSANDSVTHGIRVSAVIAGRSVGEHRDITDIGVSFRARALQDGIVASRIQSRTGGTAVRFTAQNEHTPSIPSSIIELHPAQAHQSETIETAVPTLHMLRYGSTRALVPVFILLNSLSREKSWGIQRRSRQHHSRLRSMSRRIRTKSSASDIEEGCLLQCVQS
jgi:hypothetical protein